MRVASKVGNLPSKFGHARPLGSRIIRFVRDGWTETDRRTDEQKQCLLPLPYGRKQNNAATYKITSTTSSFAKRKLILMYWLHNNITKRHMEISNKQCSEWTSKVERPLDTYDNHTSFRRRAFQTLILITKLTRTKTKSTKKYLRGSFTPLSNTFCMTINVRKNAMWWGHAMWLWLSFDLLTQKSIVSHLIPQIICANLYQKWLTRFQNIVSTTLPKQLNPRGSRCWPFDCKSWPFHAIAQLCQFAIKSVHLFSKYSAHKFANGHYEWKDENTTRPAWKRHKH